MDPTGIGDPIPTTDVPVSKTDVDPGLPLGEMVARIAELLAIQGWMIEDLQVQSEVHGRA